MKIPELRPKYKKPLLYVYYLQYYFVALITLPVFYLWAFFHRKSFLKTIDLKTEPISDWEKEEKKIDSKLFGWLNK